MPNQIDTFINDRYTYLLECANNILKLIKRQDLKYELVGDLYIHLITNQTKLQSLYDEGKIEAISVRWMLMQVKWNNTSFKKSWVYPNKHTSTIAFNELESYAIVDDVIPEEEYLQQEKEIQDKLNLIHYNAANLSLDQKLLLEAFQNGINTSGKLAHYTGLSRTGCYYMLKNLKESLKTPNNSK